MAKTPLKKLGGLPVSRIGLGGRTLKLIRPICSICQGHASTPSDWWKTCQHEPYFVKEERVVRKPIIEEREDGTKIITSHEETLEYVEKPNLGQVQFGNPRVSSDGAVAYQTEVHGYRKPEDFGFAPFCEYQNCWSQNGLKTYTTGTFCREIEAKMVAIDQRRGVKAFEVLLEEKQREQLDSIRV